MMRPLRLKAMTAVSALGLGMHATLAALREERSGLSPCDLPGIELKTYVGAVPRVDEVSLKTEFRAYDCRNNRLAELALQQDDFEAAVARARARYGARRIGVFLGTSTSGIAQTERAYAERETASGRLPAWFDFKHTHNLHSVTDYVRQRLALTGPAQTISTACSSSAKAYASAWRHMASGYCDAAVVGGADSLCQMTLYGFNALQLVSSQPCRPADRERDGMSIGEAASFTLLEWEETGSEEVRLLGYGESSDAYHSSSPHPEGAGAALAMRLALKRAALAPDAIDYVNLHGSATPANDLAEDKAVAQVLGTDVACSSTKGWTGHTLGAAGAIEAAIASICIRHGIVPGSLNTLNPDPALSVPPVRQTQLRPVRRVLSNSFGFGGSNCSLLFGAS